MSSKSSWARRRIDLLSVIRSTEPSTPRRRSSRPMKRLVAMSSAGTSARSWNTVSIPWARASRGRRGRWGPARWPGRTRASSYLSPPAGDLVERDRGDDQHTRRDVLVEVVDPGLCQAVAQDRHDERSHERAEDAAAAAEEARTSDDDGGDRLEGCGLVGVGGPLWGGPECRPRGGG